MNGQSFRGRIIGILGFSGKQKGGVLQGEGNQLGLPSLRLECLGQSVIEGGESASQWVGRTDDQHLLHQSPNLDSSRY